MDTTLLLLLVNYALYFTAVGLMGRSANALRTVATQCKEHAKNRRGHLVACGTKQASSTGFFFIPTDTRNGYNGTDHCEYHTSIDKRLKRLNRIKVGITLVLALLTIRHFPLWFGPTGQRTFTIATVILVVQVAFLLAGLTQAAKRPIGARPGHVGVAAA